MVNTFPLLTSTNAISLNKKCRLKKITFHFSFFSNLKQQMFCTRTFYVQNKYYSYKVTTTRADKALGHTE